MAPQEPEQIRIECINYKTMRVFCDGQWRTVRKYDKGFSEIYKCFHICKIAHGIACGCSTDDKTSD